MRPEQARGSIGIIFDQPESAFPFSHRFGGSAGQENGGRRRGDSPARRRACRFADFTRSAPAPKEQFQRTGLLHSSKQFCKIHVHHKFWHWVRQDCQGKGAGSWQQPTISSCGVLT